MTVNADGTPSGAKKIAGKYDTVEEAEKAILEQEKKLTEAQEKSKRLEEVISAFPMPGQPPIPQPGVAEGQPGGVPVSDYSRVIESPVETLKKVKEDAVRDAVTQVRAEYEKMRVQEAQAKAMHDKFYSDNPELVEHKLIVGAIANQVGTEMPGKSVNDIFAETAKRSKEYLIKLSKAPDAPAPPADGGTGGDGHRATPPKNEEPKLTPEEEYLQERNSIANKTLNAKK